MPPRVDQVGIAQVPPVGLQLVAGGLDDVWVSVCVAEVVVRDLAEGVPGLDGVPLPVLG